MRKGQADSLAFPHKQKKCDQCVDAKQENISSARQDSFGNHLMFLFYKIIIILFFGFCCAFHVCVLDYRWVFIAYYWRTNKKMHATNEKSKKKKKNHNQNGTHNVSSACCVPFFLSFSPFAQFSFEENEMLIEPLEPMVSSSHCCLVVFSSSSSHFSVSKVVSLQHHHFYHKIKDSYFVFSSSILGAISIQFICIFRSANIVPDVDNNTHTHTHKGSASAYTHTHKT